MSAILTQKLLTAEELFRMPEDEGWCLELVRGVIIKMSPPGFYHGLVCARIDQILGTFVFQNQLGYTGCNDPGVILERDPDTVRGPDVAFWRRDRVTNVREESYTDIVPDLAIEVLSPNDETSEVLRKVQEYLQAGVQMVWVIGPEDHSVLIHRQGQAVETLGGADMLRGDPVVPGFSCPVASLFP